MIQLRILLAQTGDISRAWIVAIPNYIYLPKSDGFSKGLISLWKTDSVSWSWHFVYELFTRYFLTHLGIQQFPEYSKWTVPSCFSDITIRQGFFFYILLFARKIHFIRTSVSLWIILRKYVEGKRTHPLRPRCNLYYTGHAAVLLPMSESVVCIIGPNCNCDAT